MPILDGKQVIDAEIDLTRHKFIGMFRLPFKVFEQKVLSKMAPFDCFMCCCGQALSRREGYILDEIYSHWYIGHMDEPIYETFVPCMLPGFCSEKVET